MATGHQIETLRERLASWTDRDDAGFEIALCFGLIEPEAVRDVKHVFWSSNVLGDALDDILMLLVKIGALEHDPEEQRVRWNPEFQWRAVAAKPGR
jgi:hypothetical protein